MCFSPTASFAAGAALTLIGAATLRHAKSKREWPLAAVPLLFAIQQTIEGLLWLILLQGKTDFWMIQAYAFFAGVVWPMLIPLALFLVEPNRERQRMILAFGLIGSLVGIYSLLVIDTTGIQAEIVNHCVAYSHAGMEAFYPLKLSLYVLATCGAFFCSSYGSLRIIGWVNILVFSLAFGFYEIGFASIWCFFAAAVSSLIYGHFAKREEMVEAFARAMRWRRPRL